MIVKNLKLKNFRNYSELDVNLSDKLNIFIGNNAQGKSNLLESIVVLALTKSYLNVKDENLVKDGEDISVLQAEVINVNNKDNYFVSFSSKHNTWNDCSVSYSNNNLWSKGNIGELM